MTIRVCIDDGVVIASSDPQEQKEISQALDEVTQRVYEALSEEEKKEVDSIGSVVKEIDKILESDDLLDYQRNTARVVRRITNAYRVCKIYKDPALVSSFSFDVAVSVDRLKYILSTEDLKRLQIKLVDSELQSILSKINTWYETLSKTKVVDLEKDG